MAQFAIKCGCGRSMNPDGRSGRHGFRCGCGVRIQVSEHPATTRRCTYGECRTLATTKEPLRFCPDHQQQAASLLAHIAADARLLELDEGLNRSYRTRSRRYGLSLAPLPTRMRHAPLVYFARRDRLVKIGWTTHLDKRMQAMQANVLATEPGDIVDERRLHRRFGHLLAQGKEWFHPGADLIAYINVLREAAGASPITAKSPPMHERIELAVYLAETTVNPIRRTLTRNGQPLAGRLKDRSPDQPTRVHAALTGPTAGTIVAACLRAREIDHGGSGQALIPASEAPAEARCAQRACRSRWASLPD